jgi:hypothetical protein
MIVILKMEETYFESSYQFDSNQKNKSELIKVISLKTAQQKSAQFAKRKLNV